MSNDKKRIQIISLCVVITFLSLSTQVNAQRKYSVRKVTSTSQDSGSNVISEKEKVRLKKQFGGDEFHIADDGTVVFTPKSSEVVSGTSTTKDVNFLDEHTKGEEDESVVKESTLVVDNQPSRIITSKKNEDSDETSDFIIKKDKVLNLTQPSTDTAEKSSPASDRTEEKNITVGRKEIKTTSQTSKTAIAPKQNVVKNKGESAVVERTQSPVKARQNTGKNNKTSYQNAEEAILDLEIMIAEIKKEMSNDLTKRVKGSSGNNFDNLEGDNFMTVEDYESVVESEPNYEPSYFINGVQVDKQEFDKLRPKDVKSREFKTQTKNPNGEIWIETYYK